MLRSLVTLYSVVIFYFCDGFVSCFYLFCFRFFRNDYSELCFWRRVGEVVALKSEGWYLRDRGRGREEEDVVFRILVVGFV